MKGFFSGALVQWFFRPWREPLANSARGFIEPPQPNTQLPECVDVCGSYLSYFKRKHKQRTIGKVAIAKRLLQTSPPIGYLTFNCGQLNTAPQFECSKITCSPHTGPSYPDDVCPAKAIHGELATRKLCATILSETDLLELIKEVRFSAFLRKPRRQVLPRVIAFGRQQNWWRSFFQGFVLLNGNSSIEAFDQQCKPVVVFSSRIAESNVEDAASTWLWKPSDSIWKRLWFVLESAFAKQQRFVTLRRLTALPERLPEIFKKLSLQ